MNDFNYYWPKYHASPPTETQLNRAKRDWRAGSTGWEGVQIAREILQEAELKQKQVLLPMGGRHYRIVTQSDQK